jgi:hypothetical protein
MARGVAWGVELRDWSGGFVANNVMLGEPGLPNTFFLAFRGGFTGTRVEGNYCSGVIASTGTIALDGGPGQAITFRDNLFDVSDGIALSSQAPPVAIVWERNDFEPVPLPSRATRIKLRAGTKPTPVGALQTLVGEPLPVLPDPTVDLPLAWDEFLARVREQGQADAWDEALTASAINARVRAAVGIGPSL